MTVHQISPTSPLSFFLSFILIFSCINRCVSRPSQMLDIFSPSFFAHCAASKHWTIPRQPFIQQRFFFPSPRSNYSNCPIWFLCRVSFQSSCLNLNQGIITIGRNQGCGSGCFRRRVRIRISRKVGSGSEFWKRVGSESGQNQNQTPSKIVLFLQHFYSKF